MNNARSSSNYLTKRSSSGFMLLGTALFIFLILSLFSIYLLRIVVNENVISGYNLLDIRTRNLSQTGLEHGLQLFKENGTPYVAPIERSFNNGNYTIEEGEPYGPDTFNWSYERCRVAFPTS